MSQDTRQSPGGALLRNPIVHMLSSVWFGVTVLSVLLLYAAVLVLPYVRVPLEMTEMEAFAHWSFVGLVILLAVSTAAATFFRTAWQPARAGAIITHVGVLLLILGCLLYFGTKVEGDMVLEMPAIQVRAGMGERQEIAASFPAVEGQVWSPMQGEFRVTVLATEAADTQPVSLAKVRVEIAGQPMRQIELAEFGRWTPIHEGLALRLLTFPPETVFYERDSGALYISETQSGVDLMRVLDGLPHFRPRYPAECGMLVDTGGMPVPSARRNPHLPLFGADIPTGWFERRQLPIEVDTTGLPFTLEVTGFVPYVAGLRQVTGEDGRMCSEPVLARRHERNTSPSAIRIRVTGRDEHADWTETHWCLFQAYPMLQARPLHVHVPGSPGHWRIVFSRPQRSLAAAITGERLALTFFPGRQGIESYRSDVRIKPDGAGEAYDAIVKTNQTHTVGQWTLYQSSYDSEGLWRYTVLGVGNRNGIMLMNAGWVLITLGCIFAFYVKPVLLRRQRMRSERKPGTEVAR